MAFEEAVGINEGCFWAKPMHWYSMQPLSSFAAAASHQAWW
jgi:hypothetical protein